MKSKRNRNCVITTAIFFVLWIAFVSNEYFNGITINKTFFIIGAIPLLACLLLTVVSFGWTESDRLFKVFKHTVIVVAIFITFFTFFFAIVTSFNNEERDYKDYKRAVKTIKSVNLSEYFPKDVPIEGKNIDYYANPAVLQAPEVLRLSYDIDKEALEKIKEENKNRAIKAYNTIEEEMWYKSAILEAVGYDEGNNNFDVFILEDKPNNSYDPVGTHRIVVWIGINWETNRVTYEYEKS